MRNGEMTTAQQRYLELNAANAPTFDGEPTLAQLLQLVNASVGTMPATYYARTRLTIEDMRHKVMRTISDNVFYIRNDMKVDPNRCSKPFVNKPTLLFAQQGGTFAVGARFGTKWLKLDTDTALHGVERDKLEMALRGLGILAQTGHFDEQILALDDARREQIVKNKQKKAA